MCLDENHIIKLLTKQFPFYIGDDAAIIPINDDKSYVISKDLLTEENHFSIRYFDAESLAHKSLHSNLSDMAAMGAKGKFILLGLSVPRDFNAKYIEDFLQYFSTICKRNDIVLIGGDTTRSANNLSISITIIGEIDNIYLKLRNTAKHTDIICVVGSIGEAHAGLMAFEKNTEKLSNIKNCLLRPNAKTREGVWLSKRREVTAMMDISDGLLIDLKRLCAASKVGATLELEKLRASDSLKKACHVLGIDPSECILLGGEDFSLLTTINANMYEIFSKEFAIEFGYKPIPVGVIENGTEVNLKAAGGYKKFSYQPFSHFGE